MKKTILFISVALGCASPAHAQIRQNSNARSDPNPTMVRTPPSILPGAGLSPDASSPSLTYPAPIKRPYDPSFVDPTSRNPYLRQR